MAGGLTIALAQVNVTVGALEDNRHKIVEAAHTAQSAGAQLVLFPELALSGYPPEDLLLKRHFVEACEQQLERLAEELPPDIIVLVGTPRSGPERAFNGAAVFHGGRLAACYHKLLLPNYGVFDEQRVLSPGTTSLGLEVAGHRLGIHICEDSWYEGQAPCVAFKGSGLSAVLNLSSSPYHRAKLPEREEVLGRLARALESHVLYCNLVGGQDELVFDGASMVLDPAGKLLARGKQFEEEMLFFTLPSPETNGNPFPSKPSVKWVALDLPETTGESAPLAAPGARLDDHHEVYAALRLGLHDYVAKNGFRKALVAISGGIDSALVAAVAVDALGKDSVVGITMPSKYSSEGTKSDAYALAENLGIEMHTVAIEPLFELYQEELAPLWPGREPDVTEENLQARIRGNIVMAMSNKFGWLVLTTGNKSELATGYCTLYGDMAGGFAVIKDVPKTLVFELCAWRNDGEERPVIPPSIITRPPSAELRDDQKDTDSLPPYDVLDAILERYVEGDKGFAELVSGGFDREIVARVIRMVDLNEYKRRQGAPGIKITPKAFGRDRRLPITNQFRQES